MANVNPATALKRRIAIAIVLLALIGAGAAGWWFRFGQHSGKVAYRTAEVRKTSITASITATGTVVPEEVIDVGAQVNGLVASFGTDADGKPVDYRSNVAAGTVLARIDDTLYSASEAAAEASLSQTQAQVKVNETNVAAAQAKLDQARKDWARAQKLGPSKSLSQADYDAAQSAYEQAVAGLDQTKASVLLAQASVAIAEASLRSARQNLVYCTIKSPVKGVIIDRRVEIGQTVVSSLSAPSLFLLAKDLTKMLVLVQTNEADVGHVHPGDTVSFTADAFPGASFTGEVRKIRLNATQTQNVVTYTSEIMTDNTSLKLLPYLTANVNFVIDHKEQVLAVPNAALRWSPRNFARAGGGGSGSGGAGGGAGGGGGDAPRDGQERRPGGGPPGGPGNGPGNGPGGGRAIMPAGGPAGGHPGSGAGGGPGGEKKTPPATLWVLGPEGIRMERVRAGISDGTMTEVTGAGIHEGDQVVIDEATVGTPGTTTSNPFAPRLTGGRR